MLNNTVFFKCKNGAIIQVNKILGIMPEDDNKFIIVLDWKYHCSIIDPEEKAALEQCMRKNFVLSEELMKANKASGENPLAISSDYDEDPWRS